MGHSTNGRGIPKSRRDVLLMGGAASVAAAANFPLVNVVRADNAKLKIGFIGCMSGNRTDFGAADPWVLERVKATVKGGLKINGKNYAVEFILKDNQSDPNQTNVVAKELILSEKCDLVLTNDGENIAGAAGRTCGRSRRSLDFHFVALGSLVLRSSRIAGQGLSLYLPLLHRRRRRLQSLCDDVEYREDQQGRWQHVHGFAGWARIFRSATRSAASVEEIRI